MTADAGIEDLLRELAPRVLGVLVRRYEDFAVCEDGVQDALVAALQHWTKEGSASQDALDFLASWAATLDQLDQPATAHAPTNPDPGGVRVWRSHGPVWSFSWSFPCHYATGQERTQRTTPPT